ncbi:MAG: DUF2934 domain-containing protein [Nitrospirota bacterium]|jgi:hypothetical protein
MIPSSKSKESATARVVPPPTEARPGGTGVPSRARSESAQKFKVWPEDRRERIAAKAYELWEQRGCRQGYDLEDWLDAEALVVESQHEAPK